MSVNSMDILIYYDRLNKGDRNKTFKNLSGLIDLSVYTPEKITNDIKQYRDKIISETSLKDDVSTDSCLGNPISNKYYVGFSIYTQHLNPSCDDFCISTSTGALQKCSGFEGATDAYNPMIEYVPVTDETQNYMPSYLRIPRFFRNFTPLTMEITDLQAFSGSSSDVTLEEDRDQISYNELYRNLAILFNNRYILPVLCDTKKHAQKLMSKIFADSREALNKKTVIIAPDLETQNKLGTDDVHSAAYLYSIGTTSDGKRFISVAKIITSEFLDITCPKNDELINKLDTYITTEESDEHFLRWGVIAPVKLFIGNNNKYRKMLDIKDSDPTDPLAKLNVTFAVPGNPGCWRNFLLKTTQADFCDSYDDVIEYVLPTIRDKIVGTSL